MKKIHIAIATFMVAALIPSLIAAYILWVWVKNPSPVSNLISTRDYLNVWAGSRLALGGDIGTLFTPSSYYQWVREHILQNIGVHTWSYPPGMLLVALPFAFLPAIPGFLIYGLGSLGIFATVCHFMGLRKGVILATLLSPAVLENFLAGQNGALTAALTVGAFAMAESKPYASGIFAGILTIKPQLGLLYPIAAISKRNYKAITAALLTTALIALLTLAVFGSASWVLFFERVEPFMKSVMLAPFQKGAGQEMYQRIMGSPFMYARWQNASVTEAYLFQGVFSVVSLGAIWKAWRMPNVDPSMRLAVSICLSLIATPYSFNYDMIGVALSSAIIAGTALESEFRPGEAVMLAAAWAWPGCAMWIGMAGAPPLGFVCDILVAICAWQRMDTTPERGSRDIVLGREKSPFGKPSS